LKLRQTLSFCQELRAPDLQLLSIKTRNFFFPCSFFHNLILKKNFARIFIKKLRINIKWLRSTGLLTYKLLKRYSYRGYADPSVPIDRFSRLAGQELFSAFLSLAQSELMRGNSTACEQIKSELVKRLPLERIRPPEELLQRYENLCDSRNRK